MPSVQKNVKISLLNKFIILEKLVTNLLVINMKYSFFLAFLLLIAKSYAGSSQEGEYQWSVNKRNAYFSLSAEFDCKRGDALLGSGFRTYAGCPRYYYDLFDAQNAFEARGITRFFSLGMLASWGMDIDLYDPQGVFIGLIEGKVFTRSRAKFIFYDARSVPVANAFLNTETAEFVITPASSDTTILGFLKGRDFGDIASWELTSFRPLPIDPRILKVFALFVADYHRDFLPQPKEVHYNNAYYFYSFENN